MEKRIDELTPAQQARIPEWADRWTEIGLRTGAADREKFEKGAEGCYRAAGFHWHNRVVWVASPIVVALAGPVAAFVIDIRRRRAVNGVVSDAVHRALRRVVHRANGTRRAVRGGVVGDAVCRVVDDVVNLVLSDVTRHSSSSVNYSSFFLSTPVRVEMDSVSSDVRNTLHHAVRHVLEDLGYTVSNAVLDVLPLLHVGRAEFFGDVINSGGVINASSQSTVNRAVDYALTDPLYYPGLFGGQFGYHVLDFPVYEDAVNSFAHIFSFFREEPSLKLADNPYEETMESACWWYAHQDFVMVSERPMVIHRELINPSITRGPNSHRLHCADGPAIAFQDGWGVYAVHGVRIPFKQRHIVERPETITVEEIETEHNAEIRRVMIDRYGPARYVADSGAQIVCELGTDHPIVGLRTARLLRKGVPGDEPIFYADLLNSTPEPDGTVKRYMLRIDPNAYDGEASRNLLAAAASTWRNADGSLHFADWRDYAPVFES